MQEVLLSLILDESAQGLTEYAMILACVVLACLTVFRPLAEPVILMINKTIGAFSE